MRIRNGKIIKLKGLNNMNYSKKFGLARGAINKSLVSKDKKAKEKFLKAAKQFRDMADLYEEMASLYVAEETKENEDKLTMLIGKLMIALSEIDNIKSL